MGNCVNYTVKKTVLLARKTSVGYTVRKTSVGYTVRKIV